MDQEKKMDELIDRVRDLIRQYDDGLRTTEETYNFVVLVVEIAASLEERTE